MKHFLRGVLLLFGIVASLASDESTPFGSFDLRSGGTKTFRLQASSSDKPESLVLHLQLGAQISADAGAGQLVGFLSDRAPTNASALVADAGNWNPGQDAGELGTVGFALPLPLIRDPQRFDGRPGGYEPLTPPGTSDVFLTLHASGVPASGWITLQTDTMRDACKCKVGSARIDAVDGGT